MDGFIPDHLTNTGILTAMISELNLGEKSRPKFWKKNWSGSQFHTVKTSKGMKLSSSVADNWWTLFTVSFKDPGKRVQEMDDLVTYSRNLLETLELRHCVFKCELQEEREKNKALQEELEAVKVSYNEDHLQHETQLTDAKQLFDSLQESMKEIQEDNLVTNSKDLLQTLELRQHVLECELQDERERNKALQEELEGMKASYSEASLQYETELINAKQLIDTLQRELQQEKHQKEVLQEELEELQNTSAMEALKEAEESEEMPCMKQESICDAPALEVQEEKLSETTPKKPSSWKRARHFLGLRKPRRWKK